MLILHYQNNSAVTLQNKVYKKMTGFEKKSIEGTSDYNTDVVK